MDRQGWIGVDLDGTLAKHYWPQDGPYDPLRIGDPVPAMVERVKAWIAQSVEVRIVTARVGPQEGMDDIGPIYRAIWNWTQEHIGTKLTPTCMKDYSGITYMAQRRPPCWHTQSASYSHGDAARRPAHIFETRP